jgi:hypothetical protein
VSRGRKLSRRFLAPGAGHGDGHGYVDEPLRKFVRDDPPEVRDRIRDAAQLRDEPECVDSDAIATFGDVARRNDALRRAAEIEQLREVRQRLTIPQRLADAQWRAKRQRMDVTGDVFFIRKTLERKRPDNAIRRLEALEARIDHAQSVAAAL